MKQQTGLLLGLGFNMLAGMLLFTGLGYWFDKKNDSSWGTLAGMFCGLFYGGYEVWKLLRNLNRDS